MKKFAAWFAVIVLVVGGGVATFWPIDFWRLFDANQRPLALTEAENWCAGNVGMANTRFKENDPAVLRCIEQSGRDNEHPSIANSVHWACLGIVQAGWDGIVLQCEDIFASNQMWMLLGGAFTNQWSDAYPRPVPLDEGVLEEPDTRENRSTGVSPYGYGEAPNTQTEDEDE